MKKLFLASIFAILITLSLSAITSYALDPKYETIKVGLSYGSSAKSQVTVSSVGGFNVGYMSGSTFINAGYGFSEVTLNIAPCSATSIYVNGTAYDLPADNFALAPLNAQVNIDGTVYRGGVEFVPDANGKLTVINFVNINDYIAGVVGKEMSPSWNIEALKAQAVCARSYAIRTWNKHSSYGFNLCSTQDCQAYMGMSGETDSTVRAAAETRDQLLMYGGSVAEALYSSSCGGSTAHARNVWGNDVAYLKAIQDPYDQYTNNPRASWTVTLTRADIQSKLASKSIYIGDVTDFRVTRTDEFGRTCEVTIYGTAGTHVLTNDKTRSFFNLYSQNYTITPSGSPYEYAQAQQAMIDVVARHSGGTSPVGTAVAKSSQSTAALGDNYYIKDSHGTTLHTAPVPVAPSYGSDSYVINGAGWGHGLGLCQYGAKGMADQGFDYVSILKFYYPGTDVR
ncbi:MAG: SpoIID/LytB domain-containing protein [Ruminococcaceae bacterium]|nr:SpoIID/LytB domain-containing protein [Oscillospiraceae bacterium]